MADTSAPGSLDFAEQVTRVLRAIEESQKFVAEQKKLVAEAAKLERDRARDPGRSASSGWRPVPRSSGLVPPS